jgi:HK97 gp10 family phage protein
MSSITVKYNNFAKIAAALPKATGVIVRKAAFDVEATAKTLVPVDTGMLKNSIMTEEVSPTSMIVAPHTEYAAYVEWGTVKMAARPYLRPAAERVRAPFVYAMSKLEERLK